MPRHGRLRAFSIPWQKFLATAEDSQSYGGYRKSNVQLSMINAARVFQSAHLRCRASFRTTRIVYHKVIPDDNGG